MNPMANKSSESGFQSSNVLVSTSGSSTSNQNRRIHQTGANFSTITQVSTSNKTNSGVQSIPTSSRINYSDIQYSTENFRPANNMMNSRVSQQTNFRMSTSFNSGFESYPTFTVTSGIPTASYSELYFIRFIGNRPINTNQVSSTPGVAPEASTGLAATKNFGSTFTYDRSDLFRGNLLSQNEPNKNSPMSDSDRLNFTLSRILRNQQSDYILLGALGQQIDRNHKTYESRFDTLDQRVAEFQNRFDNLEKRFDDLYDKLHDVANAKSDRTLRFATVASVLQIVFLIAIIVLLSVQLNYINQLL